MKCHSDSNWWALTTARYSGGTTLPNVVRRGFNLDVLQLGNLATLLVANIMRCDDEKTKDEK